MLDELTDEKIDELLHIAQSKINFIKDGTPEEPFDGEYLE